MKSPFLRVGMVLLSVGLLMFSGCQQRGKYRQDLVSAQTHAREMYAQNQRLLMANEEAGQLVMALEGESQALQVQLGETQTQLSTANERIENLMAERQELSDRYARALNDSVLDSGGSDAAMRLDGFEFDAVSGMHKFRTDILFDLGSDTIRPEAQPALTEFSATVNSGAAGGMKILVVGHTDDQSIVRPETAMRHPTNWHLSTDRSDAVILELLKHGIAPERIASMGYSEFQPLERSTTETSRQRNRRVELYVVPGKLSAAGWDPITAVR